MESNEYRKMREIEDAYWWFSGRRDLLLRIFSALMIYRKEPPEFLDIGCGTGSTMGFCRRYGQVTGIDYSADALHFSRGRGFYRLVRGDICRRLPFADQSFSLITCLDVLEHIEPDRRLLQEMHRVCRPGGFAVVTVPAFPFMWSDHDDALHHLRRYTRPTFLRRIAASGWTPVKTSYFNTVLFAPIWLVRGFKKRLRKNRPPRSDFYIPMPDRANRLLAGLLRLEAGFLGHVDFPFGVSLLGVLHRPGSETPSGRIDGIADSPLRLRWNVFAPRPAVNRRA